MLAKRRELLHLLSNPNKQKCTPRSRAIFLKHYLRFQEI